MTEDLRITGLRPGIYEDGPDVIIAFKAAPHLDAALEVRADREQTSTEEETTIITVPPENRAGFLAAVRVKNANRTGLIYRLRVDYRIAPDPYARRLVDGWSCLSAADKILAKDTRPLIAPADRIIYKIHPKGFTKLKKGLGEKAGTFAAIPAMIPYIKGLGFNVVEMMPIYAWESEAPQYWGYTAQNHFFAPKEAYGCEDPVAELKKAVAALHKAGLLCYMECHIPAGTDPLLVIEALRYWYEAYHMDGFRLLGNGVPADMLLRDPALRRAALLFEYVPMPAPEDEALTEESLVFTENDEFLAAGRSYLRGDEGMLSRLADVVLRHGHQVKRVNYMANVNGFTLLDAVTYKHKRNEKNGEGGFDGTNENYSQNGGVEGPTKKSAVNRYRYRQIKNALAYLFLAQGNPLLMAGDERGRTQMGNNNAYASDDPVGWLSWESTTRSRHQVNFVRDLIAFRQAHPILHAPKPLVERDDAGTGCPMVAFLDKHLWYSEFNVLDRSIGILYNEGYATDKKDQSYLYVLYNSGDAPDEIAIPDAPAGKAWQISVNTAAEDGAEFETAVPLIENGLVTVPERSVLVLTTV
ncbi:MAG: hypothetical protein Q4B73_01960 [Lachnospiraceae bacterium]|nr:hypothetical protein [Lachnospiraceae bacterium]